MNNCPESYNNSLVVHNFVLSLPSSLTPLTIYFVKEGADQIKMYVTDSQSNPYLIGGDGQSVVLNSPNGTISINGYNIDISQGIMNIINSIQDGFVKTVNGDLVDNTDPANPIILKPIWGDIGGTIINQTDLVTFVNNSISTASGDYVKKTGEVNQTIEGSISIGAGLSTTGTVTSADGMFAPRFITSNLTPADDAYLTSKFYVDNLVGAKPFLGETSTTAYRGDRGKIAYDHSQTTGNPHNTQIADILGLQIAFDGKVDKFIKSNEPLSGAQRNGDILYGILDQYTGEEITLFKVTGAPTVDSIMYFQLGSEYFMRIVPLWYNVKWWGTKGDGITDDTLKIQASINFVSSNKGGTIFFPIGIYIVAGNLVTTDNTGKNPNSQLYIPSQKDAGFPGGTKTAIGIRFLGEVPPSINASGFADDKIDLMTKGVMIKSTLPYSSISGTYPSVIGGKADTPGYGFNILDTTFENIWIRTHHDSTHGTYMCAFNMSDVAFNTFYRCRADIDVAGWNSVESDTISFGFMGVKSNGGTTNVFYNCESYGYKVGYTIGEHGVVDNCSANFCTWGYDLQKAGHSSSFYHNLSQWNKYTFTFGKYDWGYVSDHHYISCAEMVVENLAGGKWYDTVKDIDDTSNGIYGNVFFSKTISGQPIGDDAPLTKNGGVNINAKHVARFITTYEKDRTLLVDTTINPTIIPVLKVKGSNDVYTSIDVFAKNITDGNQLKVGQFANGNVLISNEGNKAIEFYTNGSKRFEILGNGNASFTNELTIPTATQPSSAVRLDQIVIKTTSSTTPNTIITPSTATSYRLNTGVLLATLPPLTGNAGVILFLINTTIADIPLNSNAGGNDIWSGGASVNNENIPAGSAIRLIHDGTQWVLL